MRVVPLDIGSLSGVLARDPREALRAIGAYAQKYGFGAVGGPEVTVYISSGNSLSGKVVRCDSDRDAEFILLKQGEDSDPSLLYVRLNDVVALQVQRASSVADIFGTSQSARSGTPPTKLQLKRQLEKMGEDLRAIGKTIRVDYQWPSAEESDNVRFGLAEFTQALDRILKKMASQPLGSDALSPVRLIQIRHEAGAVLVSTRKGTDIAIAGDLGRPPSANLDAQLEKSIESAL